MPDGSYIRSATHGMSRNRQAPVRHKVLLLYYMYSLILKKHILALLVVNILLNTSH